MSCKHFLQLYFVLKDVETINRKLHLYFESYHFFLVPTSFISICLFCVFVSIHVQGSFLKRCLVWVDFYTWEQSIRKLNIALATVFSYKKGMEKCLIAIMCVWSGVGYRKLWENFQTIYLTVSFLSLSPFSVRSNVFKFDLLWDPIFKFSGIWQLHC